MGALWFTRVGFLLQKFTPPKISTTDTQFLTRGFFGYPLANILGDRLDFPQIKLDFLMGIGRGHPPLFIRYV